MRTPRGTCGLDARWVAVLVAGTVLYGPLLLHVDRHTAAIAEDDEPDEDIGAYKPKPLPAGPKAPCQRDLQKLQLAWHRRTLAGAYRNVGKRDPKWDKDALDFLEMCALYFSKPANVPRLKGAPTIPLLAATGKRVIDAGCDDPLILYEYGVILQLTDKPAEAETFIRRAVAGFRTSRYPRARMCSAPNRLAELCKKRGGKAAAEVDSWLKLKFDWTVQCVRDDSYRKGEERIFYMYLGLDIDDVFEKKLKELYEALKAEPKADPWVVAMIGGRYHINAAWEARGSKRASKVTDEGWVGFGKHLELARKELVKAWQLHPEYPEAAGTMITVVMGGCTDNDTERMWFDRAVAAQFDYMPAYHRLRWALRPRWGGSLRAVYALGLECLKTGRFDTRVPMEYLEALQTLDDDGIRRLYRKEEVYRNVTHLCEGAVAAPGWDDDFREYYRSVQAAAAWGVRKYAVARRLLDQLGRRVNYHAFKELRCPWGAGAVGEVYAATGPAGDKYLNARTWWKQGHMPRAINAMQDVLTASGEHLMAQAHVTHLLGLWRVRQALTTGAWIDLLPRATFDGWVNRLGGWRRQADGSVLAYSNWGTVRFLFDEPVGDDFEMYAEIEWLADLKPGSVSGVCLGWSRAKLWRCARLRVDHASGFACVQEDAAWRDAIERGRKVNVKRSYRLRVQVWRSHITAHVNDMPVVIRYPSRYGVFKTGQSLVGMGPRKTRRGARMVFRQLLVRRLLVEPDPPPTTQPAGEPIERVVDD